MPALPVYDHVPSHLAHRTGLKKEGRAPTGPPVAVYRFRHHNGYASCELFSCADTRPLKEALAARTRRLAALNGQLPLL